VARGGSRFNNNTWLGGGSPPEAARALLRLDFDKADRARMHELAKKNQEIQEQQKK